MATATSNGDIDLAYCSREELQFIGRVQSFAWLVAFSSEWILNHISVNCHALTGKNAADMIGVSAAEFLDGQALHDIRGRLQLQATADAVDRIFEIDLLGDGRKFDVAVYRSDRSFILEIERSESGRLSDLVGYVRPMVGRMRQSKTVEKLCQSGARHLRAMTGFDRVTVYRFGADDAGHVIAEARSSGVDSYLGLHFPSSDIPAQARALYARNMLRIVVDVDDEPCAIFPSNSGGAPLDLSMSGIRAVSQVHIEYLRNMGVKASMSVSIMRRGQLWGLFACHHYKPLKLSYSVRTAAELFGEFFSSVLEQIDSELVHERRRKSRDLHDEVMASAARHGSLSDAFPDFAEPIADVIPHDGMAAWIDGEYLSLGSTPSRAEFEPLAHFLTTTASGSVWASDKLSAAFPPAAAYAARCAGLLALPLSRAPRDYIVLFRKEHVHDVKWAGNPDKPFEMVDGTARIGPRKSFELWSQEQRGGSRPWNEEETAIADSLRVTLLEVALQLADTAHRGRDQVQKRQEFLIAELNHRVRNILNLVRGLVTQSAAGSESIDDFADIVGNRIYALARAHDQVTQTNWTPASLYTLIRTECRAYAGSGSERLFIRGPDAMLTPSTFTSLALVIHELMTNSSKYGALSNEAGRIDVELSRDAGNALTMCWTETGGPTVERPSRTGFGSTIIAHTVPHELNGKAAVDYRPEGLVARFVLPSQAIASFAHPPSQPSARDLVTATTGYASTQRPDRGTALVVEDNVVIALEAEKMLLELGFTAVHICGSVRNALAALDQGGIMFALLDVHLGHHETSEPIAQAMAERGIPFAVVSGIGDHASPAYAGAPAVTKPYLRSDIEAVIKRIEPIRA